MQPYCTLVPKWPLAVLLAGLISCSSDKKPEAEVRKDQWQVPEVSMLRKDGSRVKEIKTIEHEGESTDSVEFVFDPPDLSKSIRKIHAESFCSPAGAKEKVFKSTYTVENSPRFRFLDALSDDVLVRRDTKIKCTFFVTITNEIGSTKTFELIRLTLDRSNEDQLLLMKGMKQTPISNPIEAGEFDQVKFTGPAPAGRVSLYCDYYNATIDDTQLPLLRLTNLAAQARVHNNGEVDSRRANPIQACRIIMRERSETKSVSLSDFFRLDFGAPEIRISGRNDSTYESGGLSNRVRTHVIEVSNPNQFDVTVKLPYDAGPGRLTPIYRTHNDPANTGLKLQAIPGRVILEAHGRASRVGNSSIVTIPAMSSFTIEVMLETAAAPCSKVRADSGQTYGYLNGANVELTGLTTAELELASGAPLKPELFQKHVVVDFTNQAMPRVFYQRWNASTSPTAPPNLVEKNLNVNTTCL